MLWHAGGGGGEQVGVAAGHPAAEVGELRGGGQEVLVGAHGAADDGVLRDEAAGPHGGARPVDAVGVEGTPASMEASFGRLAPPALSSSKGPQAPVRDLRQLGRRWESLILVSTRMKGSDYLREAVHPNVAVVELQ